MDTVGNRLDIAVLSGKGGTGKTLVAVNLAAAAKTATYIDCDVEEPNGHLFFKPEDPVEKEVSIRIPWVDKNQCTGCRTCVDFCRFNALAYIKDRVVVFEDVCHSCGGCSMVCPTKAIGEKDKVIGKIKTGRSDGVFVASGIMNTGEASGIPIIKELLKVNQQRQTGLTLIDCPPGSSCMVMESIKDADYCILVAEPTIFGVHNLKMVVELVRLFQKPFGVVLNKCLEGENPSETYCQDEGILILDRIPFETGLGGINSKALIAVREESTYAQRFTTLLQKVISEVKHETASDS